jgi:DNA polymerase III subunit beta
MKLTAPREDLLNPLADVIGVVERKQTMPVLSNVLISARGETGLSITGTDLEVELVSSSMVHVQQAGDITVPGRKLLEIVRSLPEDASVTVSTEAERLTLRAGRSRFVLATLPAADFPVIQDIHAQQSLNVDQAILHRLIEKTHFSMAQADVRYYLNGLLIETDETHLRAVATDGHRLALSETETQTGLAGQQVIVPRKGVLELQRILKGTGKVELAIGEKHIQAQIGAIRFTSKLIDAKFPDYSRVIPANPNRIISADRELLSQALHRTKILANETYHGIRLAANENLLTLTANNPEQEEAEDHVEVNYDGPPVEIGFNVLYLLDALAAIEGEKVEIGLNDSNSSGLVYAPGAAHTRYVVMPMRL